MPWQNGPMRRTRKDFPTELAWWMYRHELSGVEVAAMLGCDPSEVSRHKTGSMSGRNRHTMANRIAELIKRPPPKVRGR
jgi:hypothetical protein